MPEVISKDASLSHLLKEAKEVNPLSSKSCGDSFKVIKIGTSKNTK